MKPLIIPALLIALFAAQSAHAGGGYDLQCLLENGEQMTLSHASDTVYISFEKPGGDAEEGGSVIKLDTPPVRRNRLSSLNQRREPLLSRCAEKVTILKALLPSIIRNMMVQAMLITRP